MLVCVSVCHSFPCQFRRRAGPARRPTIQAAGHTASGGHVGSLTAAHRSLPFGTKVRVTNLSNGHSAVVTINDRGPFVRGRIIDVSTGAANVLGMRHAGVAHVRVSTL